MQGRAATICIPVAAEAPIVLLHQKIITAHITRMICPTTNSASTVQPVFRQTEQIETKIQDLYHLHSPKLTRETSISELWNLSKKKKKTSLKNLSCTNKSREKSNMQNRRRSAQIIPHPGQEHDLDRTNISLINPGARKKKNPHPPLDLSKKQNKTTQTKHLQLSSFLPQSTDQ